MASPFNSELLLSDIFIKVSPVADLGLEPPLKVPIWDVLLDDENDPPEDGVEQQRVKVSSNIVQGHTIGENDLSGQLEHTFTFKVPSQITPHCGPLLLEELSR